MKRRQLVRMGYEEFSDIFCLLVDVVLMPAPNTLVKTIGSMIIVAHKRPRVATKANVLGHVEHR